MNDAAILISLKTDLQISTYELDSKLNELIGAAKDYIHEEGITLENTPGDSELVVMYAAYLYRKRRGQNADENGKMPRMLRWALNNRLFAEKMRADNG